MKTSFMAFVLVWSAYCANGQSAVPEVSASSMQPSPSVQAASYMIGQIGPHTREWLKVQLVTNQLGQISFSTNRAYVEIATGLYHTNALGQLIESSQTIEILPSGIAAATNGQHQIFFPPDIYTGAIQLVTPDGKQLKFRPLGLSYFDGTNSVLFAELTNSLGQVLPSGHEIIYPNAFDGISADVLCIYTKAGYEENIVLREQLPDPAEFGLNPATTRIQVLTEWFSPPQPSVTTVQLPAQGGVFLPDQSLHFGAMDMGVGRAFLAGTKSQSSRLLTAKTWTVLSGRQFLIEEVPVAALASALQNLPTPTASASRKTKPTLAMRQLKLPAIHLARIDLKCRVIKMASAPAKTAGVVLDFQILSMGVNNYTFQGDTTYYISSYLGLMGTDTFEGGAVLKYAPEASVNVSYGGQSGTPTVVWKAQPYRPIIFTAVDDNSVGETITNSSGDPTQNYYADPALGFTLFSPPPISNFRICFANSAISIDVADNFRLLDGQFVNCWDGIYMSYGSLFLGNVLFESFEDIGFYIQGSGLTVQNGTFAGVYALTTFMDSYSAANFVNCVFQDVNCFYSGNASFSGDHNGFYNCGGMWGCNGNSTTFGSNPFTTATGPMQEVGAGGCYLMDDSPLRDIGSTNIDATLLADLKNTTTYPPVPLCNVTNSTDIALIPQAQRDTDIPDLGYHYNPIDYLVDGLTITNANLVVTNGTVVAWNNQPGIVLLDGSSLVSIGTAAAPNWFTHYLTVQEGSFAVWPTSFWPTNALMGVCITSAPSASAGAIGVLRFTKWSTPAQDGVYLYNTARTHGQFASLMVKDCEFWGGNNELSGAVGSTTILNNNLFFRSSVNASAIFTSPNCLCISNSLFYGISNAAVLIQHGSSSWYIYDNLFDGCKIASSSCTGDYNGYWNCNGRLSPQGNHDLTAITGFTYASTWLGDFYQVTSDLHDNGSTTADKDGLYHYTANIDQVPEETSCVDRGYHYVAMGFNGKLLDSDGDGVPDYLEDANGNGVVDAGETSWTNYNSANGLIGANGLQVFTPLK